MRFEDCARAPRDNLLSFQLLQRPVPKIFSNVFYGDGGIEEGLSHALWRENELPLVRLEQATDRTLRGCLHQQGFTGDRLGPEYLVNNLLGAFVLAATDEQLLHLRSGGVRAA